MNHHEMNFSEVGQYWHCKNCSHPETEFCFGKVTENPVETPPPAVPEVEELDMSVINPFNLPEKTEG